MKQGWEVKKLGDAMHIARGGSPRPIKKYITDDPNGINWIKIGDASDSSKYIYKTKEKINKDGLHKTRFVEEGDFLLSNSMSFGRPYIMKTTGCIHDGWLVLKENNTTMLDKDFLYHLLCSPYIFEQFDRLAAGSTVRNLNIGLVSSVEIPIPPLDEQKRIVAKLDECFEAIDKARVNVEKNLNNAKELFQSQLNQIFSQKGDGWVEKKLGEVAKYEKTKNIDNSLPYVGLEHIESNSGRFIGSFEPHQVKSLTFYFNSNHILYGRLRPYLNKVLMPAFEGHCSTEIFPILVNESVLREYLFYWFILENTVKKIDATWTGARMPRANMNQVIDFKLPIPPIGEQATIVEKMDTLSSQTQSLESNYQQELDALDELKKSILQKAFNGEL